MKKIVLLVLLIAVISAVSFSLVACSNATTQGQLADFMHNHDYEHYTYDVVDTSTDTTVTGVYEVTAKRFPKGTNIADFGGQSLTNLKKGILITDKLEIGSSVYQTGCYFVLNTGSGFLIPVASYRLQTKDNVETLKLQGTYSGSDFQYVLNKDGTEKSGTVSVKSPFYDNNQFHQTLRGVTTMSTGLKFGFKVPVVASEITSADLTASCNAVEKIKTPFTDTYKDAEDKEIFKTEGVECFKILVSRATEVKGASQTLYYAKNNIDIDRLGVQRILMKIVEPAGKGSVTYSLSSVDASISLS